MSSYLTNEIHRFRSKQVLKTLEALSSTWSPEHLKHFLTILYAKSSQHSEKPIQYYTNEEDEPPKRQSSNLSTRLMNVFKIISESCLKNSEELPEENLFLSMVRIVCHPLVSGNYKILKANFADFTTLLGGEEKINQLFERSQEIMIENNLIRRSGILSSNKNLRTLAKNQLVCLGWTGKLELFIQKMIPVFNYKPLEMLDKMEAIFKSGSLERVPSYELEFYAQMTKDLMKTFGQKDESILNSLSGKDFLNSIFSK
jgi:hypothetical protein